MSVLYVSVGSTVMSLNFGFVAMGIAVLFSLRSKLIVYSAGPGLRVWIHEHSTPHKTNINYPSLILSNWAQAENTIL